MGIDVISTSMKLDEAELDDLAVRLARTRLADSDTSGWERGTPSSWLAELVADWKAFDPVHLQATLDRLSHVKVNLNGLWVHAILAPASGGTAAPLLLTHGWPSTFLEYVALLPLLTNPWPDAGPSATTAFDVVVPSLPGFGFSEPPAEEGMSHHQVAELWNRLMVDALGYRRYFAHGSDLGAGVTARLARAHPESVMAAHLATPGLAAPPEPWSDPVRRYIEEGAKWSADEGGYSHMHATKPSTVAAGLLDSPVALAAWIGEKWVRWSSTSSETTPEATRDHLLSTLTLYWVTRTAGYSMLPYWNYQHSQQSSLPVDDPGPTPTAIDVFGGEAVPFPKPPRELAERYFRVVHWGEHDGGGHFPAVAEPHLLAQCLRDAFRDYGNTTKAGA